MFLLLAVVLNVGLLVFQVQYTKGQQGVVVTTPSVVYSDATHKTCITLHDLEQLQLIVSINGPAIRNSHLLKSTTLYGSGCFEWDFGIYKHRLEGNYMFKVTGNYNSYQFKKHATLKVEKEKHIIFIQTDKKIYKPRDNVQFRVLIVDSKLKPRLEKIHSVYITAPCGIKMKQWNNFSIPNNQQGIAGFNLPLPEQPYIGKWTITVIAQEGGTTEVASFKVEEYVLPKFAVTIDAPSYTLRTDRTTPPRIQGKVCANYTYGKPVTGHLTLEFRDKSLVNRKTYEINGCVTFDLNGPGSGLTMLISADSVEISARVYRNATDESQGLRKNVKIFSSYYKFTFKPHSRSYFKPGLPYYGKIKVTQPDDKPAVEKEVNIKIQENGIDFDQIYASNSVGEIMFSLPPFSSNSSVFIEATKPNRNSSPYQDYITLRPWYSPSNSYLQILPVDATAQCGQNLTLNIIHMKESGRRNYITLYYKVIAHGNLVSNGSQVHNYIFSEARTYLPDGTFVERPLTDRMTEHRPIVAIPLHIQVTSEMSPSMKVLVYYIRENRETVADVMAVKVEACTANDVSVTFTDRIKQPGRSTSVTVRAHPGSICSLSVVDKSVNVLSGKNALTLSQVMDELANYDLNEDSLVETDNFCTDKLKRKLDSQPRGRGPGRGKGSDKYFYSSSPKNIDSMHAFRTSGVLVLSDMTVNNRQCDDIVYDRGRGHHWEAPWDRYESNKVPAISEEILYQSKDFTHVLKIRDYFPETWLWELQDVSETGLLTIDEELPHSITTWEASTFCSHISQGLGISPPTSIRGFQAFFLSLTLPYSMVRGEILQLPVTVFNYLSDCLVIHLSLLHKDNIYDVIGQVDHEFCVCGHESVTKYYKLKPKQLEEIPIQIEEVSTPPGDTEPVDSQLELVRDLLSLPTPKSTVASPFTKSKKCKVTKGPTNCLPQVAGFSKNNQCLKDKLCQKEKGTTMSAVKPPLLPQQYRLLQAEWQSMECVIGIEAQSIDNNGICGNSGSVSQQRNVKDVVLRYLLVEAEGRQVEYTQTSFMCPSQTGSRVKADTLQLDIPSNIVEGSDRAVISTTGDVMGPTLDGVEKLLKLPTGCGEQVMVKFSPNIYILQYLGLTNQLSETIETKAIKYLTKGYQKILKYRRRDGSYSIFGKRDSIGSTWLTAFVVKSFAQAQDFISIDSDNLEVSIKWLLNKQKTNGCFRKVGWVLDKSMKGGLRRGSNEAGLTAFVLISLLESQPYVTLPGITRAIESGFQCITQQRATDTYSLTLMAYAYSLINASVTEKERIMRLLNEQAIVNGDQIHWSKAGPMENKRKSVDVEMSSYVLMSYLENDGAEAIQISLPIVKWISTQRNSHGGFSSTQNTVLALQALAKYATLTFSQGLNSSVTITPQNVSSQSLTLNDDNRIFTGETIVPLPNSVSVEVEGTGCVLIQARVKYNVENISKTEPLFHIEELFVDEASDCKMREISICVSTNDSQATDTSMPMIEVKMVSGWNPVKSSLKGVLNSGIGLKKYDLLNNKVEFYFEEFQVGWTCLDFELKQTDVIKDTKPGSVTVYYYQSPENSLIQPYDIHHSCPEDQDNNQMPRLQNLRQSDSGCANCISTFHFDLMEKFCSATNVYLVLIQSMERYPIKVLTNQKHLRRNRYIMTYTHIKMSATCQCSQISSQRGGGYALIFTTDIELQPEEGGSGKKTLTLDRRVTVVSLSRSERFRVERTLKQFLRNNQCA